MVWDWGRVEGTRNLASLHYQHVCNHVTMTTADLHITTVFNNSSVPFPYSSTPSNTFFIQGKVRQPGNTPHPHPPTPTPSNTLSTSQGKVRQPGNMWMVRGPAEFIPSVDIEIVERRKAFPLDENEGIYVRDIKSGKVRAIVGQTYILNQDEELWNKELPDQIEKLLSAEIDPLADR